ncbi:MAG: low specificity L-threonine aldolase [Lachnospiraceae bacterium]|nr:low specificity L-threonine aldolase [Lachnospiraceae bacterium]
MSSETPLSSFLSPVPEQFFGSDYAAGAHPRVMQALAETNLQKTAGYGQDEYCREAADLIRAACRCPQADVRFLTGGTQTNMVALTALLAPYQGVAAAQTGHIWGHEAGAIERHGHRVIPLPSHGGKVAAEDLRALWQNYENDETRDHIVMPGAVYLSQPTESGTLYSLAELTEISGVCRAANLALYADGARLAYALACPENDVSLSDLAALCDAFYIGGTKCGALFGEALVFPNPGRVPHFFSVMKQNGAVLAKGRLLGVQFKALFTDGLYEEIGRTALKKAEQLRRGLRALGFEPLGSSPTNQIFVRVPDDLYHQLTGRGFGGFWSKEPDGGYVIRFVTDWSAGETDVQQLLDFLAEKRENKE